MSKVNAMQAIREARYAARMSNRTAAVAAAPAAPTAARPIAAEARTAAASELPIPVTADRPVDRPVDAADTPTGLAEPGQAPAMADPMEEEARCGHRSMNNRTCSRPAGHPEKNHRYN